MCALNKRMEKWWICSCITVIFSL